MLSGINLGANLGNAIWRSGTLAAAKQAALPGLRGIAFSAPSTESEPDFTKIVRWAAEALELILRETDFPLVNGNLPEQPAGLAWTRQSVRHDDGRVVPGEDPMGRRNFRFNVTPVEQVAEGTDRWAMGRARIHDST